MNEGAELVFSPPKKGRILLPYRSRESNNEWLTIRDSDIVIFATEDDKPSEKNI